MPEPDDRATFDSPEYVDEVLKQLLDRLLEEWRPKLEGEVGAYEARVKKLLADVPAKLRYWFALRATAWRKLSPTVRGLTVWPLDRLRATAQGLALEDEELKKRIGAVIKHQ
jgi:hypothetical protein